MRGLDVLCGFRNDYIVKPDIAALIRNGIGKIGILVDAAESVPGVNHGHGRLAVDHGGAHVICAESLAQWFLRDQHVARLRNFALVARVEIVAQHFQRDADGVANAVVHPDLSCVFLIPEDLPAGDRLFDYRGVVENADRAPHVGQGVGVAGIKGVGDRELVLGDVLCVRNLFHIERQQHVVCNQLLNDVFRGETHVVNAVGGTKLDQHFLIARHFHIVDGDAGFFFKQLDQRRVDVFAPIQNVQLAADLLILIAVGKHCTVIRSLFTAAEDGKHSEAENKDK